MVRIINYYYYCSTSLLLLLLPLLLQLQQKQLNMPTADAATTQLLSVLLLDLQTITITRNCTAPVLKRGSCSLPSRVHVEYNCSCIDPRSRHIRHEID